MSYVFNKEDVYAFVRTQNWQTKEQSNELWIKYCPFCGGGSHKDDWTFSINLEHGAYKCFRGSCGEAGHFVELCRDFNYRLEDDKPKVYKKLKQPPKAITSQPEAIEYLQGRGISEEICRQYEITVRADNPYILVFPFYDEKGELQSLKYRNTRFVKGKTNGSKEWFEAQTMPLLFGMKQATDHTKPLIITEGQIDSLSVAQAGLPNACSVPTGANGFTWLTLCYDWISTFPEVIVFGDHENGKITLIDTLKARLSIPTKCVQAKDYLCEKDANDILCKYGPKAIRKAIDNAALPEIQSVKDLSDVTAVKLSALDKIKTQIPEIDRIIGGLVMGELVLLTGKRGDGKSTFGSQLICAALDQGESVFAYSGELPDYHFKEWIDRQLAGYDNTVEEINEDEMTVYSVPDEITKKLNAWYKGRVFLWDNTYVTDGKAEMETLIATVERVIKQYNTRLVFIDNLMTALEANTPTNDNLFQAQSYFVGQLKKLAMQYQVCVLLIAHPRKSGNEFSNDDVSGSGDITNKADVILNYQRAKETERYESVLQITKNRLFGILRAGKNNGIPLRYSERTKRVFSLYDKQIKHYGWEKTDTAPLISSPKSKMTEMPKQDDIIDFSNEQEELPF